MNAKQQLANKLGERSKLDVRTCDLLAERIAQTQRIRAISEDTPCSTFVQINRFPASPKP